MRWATWTRSSVRPPASAVPGCSRGEVCTLMVAIRLGTRGGTASTSRQAPTRPRHLSPPPAAPRAASRVSANGNHAAAPRVPGMDRLSGMSTLVLLRHGESEWHAQGLFTGWVDVGLSASGAREAVAGGKLLRDHGLRPQMVHTSVLTRAIQTANLALEEAGLLWLPVARSWRLNERHYGAPQGKNKAQTREEIGDEPFMVWRRSYHAPPPPLPAPHPPSPPPPPPHARLP